MKIFLKAPLMVLTLLIAACANNPPQNSTIRSQAEVLQKMQEIQVDKSQQQPTIRTQEKKSIVPGIDEEGQRGKIARAMLEKSSALFLQADMNQDYLISAEEAGLYLPNVSKNFSRYDINKDDRVSWQEFLGHDKWPAPVH